MSKSGVDRWIVDMLRVVEEFRAASSSHLTFSSYCIRVREVGINASARRHGIEDGDIRHAITHAVFSDDIDPEPPVRRLHLGPDPAGNML